MVRRKFSSRLIVNLEVGPVPYERAVQSAACLGIPERGQRDEGNVADTAAAAALNSV